MGLEFEMKYRATPEVLTQIGADFPGVYTVMQMTTAYYDTPDGSLSARKWTLRCRQEDEAFVCTLKIPAAGGARGEWELECDDIHAAIPVLAEQAGLPELVELTKGGIENTCGARFVRRFREMVIGKTVAELALDQGVLTGGGKTAEFAEVELELKEGSREDVIRLASLLAASYGLVQEPKSKVARARALREG